MKSRPILFNAEMVRAILSGAKTQTRRVVKAPKGFHAPDEYEIYGNPVLTTSGWVDASSEGDLFITCPFGKPGDRLYVRETHAFITDHRFTSDTPKVFVGADHNIRSEYSTNGLFKTFYAADPNEPGQGEWEGGWRPSIHMPRWASRIELEITAVRVERLNDISEDDAKAEGVTVRSTGFDSFIDRSEVYRDAFYDLWVSINGADSWQANPWVWVVEFRRVV